MREVTRIPELRAAVLSARRAGKPIALVPTMGALHEGHLQLVDRARRGGTFVVMSIFVNPLQFGPGEDFERYPRELDTDRQHARSRGVDLLFVPEVAELYAKERAVEVVPRRLADRWEGAARPGHFDGVLTVVAKLFNIVQPDLAIFGQKDIQQATLIQAMVRDLDFPLDVDVAPTVREVDGLALSSRNRYLSPTERGRALSLSAALAEVESRWRAGEVDASRLLDCGLQVLGTAGAEVEYLALMDPETLEPVEVATAGTIVAVAARVGATRLIDNVILARA